MNSALLTREAAVQAVEFVRPAILGMMERQHVKRSALHIIVLDPVVPFREAPLGDAPLPILHEEDLGSIPREAWEHDYAAYAAEKVELTWRTGLGSHVAQQLYPHLFRPGDVKYGGSVNHQGIMVGASGVEWYYDEMFSLWVAGACRAICIQRMAAFLANDRFDHLLEPSPAER